MKVGFWGEGPEEEGDPNALAGSAKGVPRTIKDLLVAHLRSGLPLTSYRGWAECRVCGQKLGTKDLGDGTYVWPERLEHYLIAHEVLSPGMIKIAEELVVAAGKDAVPDIADIPSASFEEFDRFMTGGGDVPTPGSSSEEEVVVRRRVKKDEPEEPELGAIGAFSSIDDGTDLETLFAKIGDPPPTPAKKVRERGRRIGEFADGTQIEGSPEPDAASPGTFGNDARAPHRLPVGRPPPHPREDMPTNGHGHAPERTGTALVPAFGARAAPVLSPEDEALAQQISSAYPDASSISRSIVEVARAVGAHPFDLANLIRFESGFKPEARNPNSGATGLIQFMPRTAKGLGTSTDALSRMSASAQMPFVRKYLDGIRRGNPLSTPHLLHMAVFYPAAMGIDPMTPFPDEVVRANTYDTPNGVVSIRTPADYTDLVLRAASLSPGGQVGGGGWFEDIFSNVSSFFSSLLGGAVPSSAQSPTAAWTANGVDARLVDTGTQTSFPPGVVPAGRYWIEARVNGTFARLPTVLELVPGGQYGAWLENGRLQWRTS